MKRTAYILLLFAMSGCAQHDFSTNNRQTALRRAALTCKAVSSEVTWLSELLERMTNDASAQGQLYMGTIDGTVYFIHQPLMMSCLACVVYDCSGTRMQPSGDLNQKLMVLIKKDNILFSNIED